MRSGSRWTRYIFTVSSRPQGIGWATPPKALFMHSATCSIKFTLSDCFTAVHSNCFRSIDWLIGGVIFLPRLAVVFLPNDCLFLTAFGTSSQNIYTSTKVAKSGPRSGQKWPNVIKSGQKWPKFSKDLRNQSFRWEKITEECIKSAFIACGFVQCNRLTQFSIFFRIFLFENSLEWSFWTGDWYIAWKTNCEPFWTVSDRVGHTVPVGLRTDPWRDATVLIYSWSIFSCNFYHHLQCFETFAGQQIYKVLILDMLVAIGVFTGLQIPRK